MKKKILLTLLLLMIISITNNYYSRYYLSSYNNYFIKELIWFILGILIIYLMSKINLNFILKNSKYIYYLNIILLILTLLFGTSVNGSKSWLNIFGLSFQPSEFMKISLIIYLKSILDNRKLSDLKYLLITFLIVIIPSILVFLEPDTGPIISYIVIFISFAILKRISKKYYYIFLTVCSVIVISFLYLYFYQIDTLLDILGPNIFYRMDRLTSFFKNDGYQISTSLKSISLSGLTGIKKRVYFPEAPTDFAVTLLISNFGLLGFIIYLLIYLYFIYNLINLKKDKAIVYPVVNMLIIQSSINILMNLGLFPIVGITFPFLSYGGSSLLTYMILIGIIYNMDNYSHRNNYNRKKGKGDCKVGYKRG